MALDPIAFQDMMDRGFARAFQPINMLSAGRLAEAQRQQQMQEQEAQRQRMLEERRQAVQEERMYNEERMKEEWAYAEKVRQENWERNRKNKDEDLYKELVKEGFIPAGTPFSEDALTQGLAQAGEVNSKLRKDAIDRERAANNLERNGIWVEAGAKLGILIDGTSDEIPAETKSKIAERYAKAYQSGELEKSNRVQNTAMLLAGIVGAQQQIEALSTIPDRQILIQTGIPSAFHQGNTPDAALQAWWDAVPKSVKSDQGLKKVKDASQLTAGDISSILALSDPKYQDPAYISSVREQMMGPWLIRQQTATDMLKTKGEVLNIPNEQFVELMKSYLPPTGLEKEMGMEGNVDTTQRQRAVLDSMVGTPAPERQAGAMVAGAALAAAGQPTAQSSPTDAATVLADPTAPSPWDAATQDRLRRGIARANVPISIPFPGIERSEYFPLMGEFLSSPNEFGGRDYLGGLVGTSTPKVVTSPDGIVEIQDRGSPIRRYIPDQSSGLYTETDAGGNILRRGLRPTQLPGSTTPTAQSSPTDVLMTESAPMSSAWRALEREAEASAIPARRPTDILPVDPPTTPTQDRYLPSDTLNDPNMRGIRSSY